MNGFYVAYLTGELGSSMALFVFDSGRITGVDVGGMHYDGRYRIDDATGLIVGTMKYLIKAGRQLITGAAAGAEPIEVEFPLELPIGFADGRVLTIPSPSGVVNAKFEKVRDI